MTTRAQYLAMMTRIRGGGQVSNGPPSYMNPETFDRLPAGLPGRVGFRGLPTQPGSNILDLSVRPHASMSTEQLSSLRLLQRPEEKICVSKEFMVVRCLIIKEWKMFNLLLEMCKMDEELFHRMQSIKPTLLSIAIQIANESYESSNKMESIELARSSSLETLNENYKKMKGAVNGLSQLIKRARYG